MKLVLIYSRSVQSWRRSTEQIASPEDQSFNWFLCGKRYWDDRGFYVLEIAPGIKLYSEKSGKTYTVREVVKLKIGKKPDEASLRRHNLHGSCSIGPCKSSLIKTIPIFCQEVVFEIDRTVLRKMKEDIFDCDLLFYTTTYYDHLRSSIPSLPSREEIRKKIEASNCTDQVCKELHELMKKN